MILYGDIDEAPWPEPISHLNLSEIDQETYWRCSVAATLLKLTNNGQGGSCSTSDNLVKPYLQAEVVENGQRNSATMGKSK